MRLSIRYKILLGFALVLILSYSIQIVGFNLAERYITSQVRDIQLEKAQNAADQIQNFISRIELDHLGIAQEILQKNATSYSRSAEVTRYILKQNQFIKRISVLSTTGRELLKMDRFGETPEDLLNFEIPTQPFNQAVAGYTGISKIYFAENSLPHIDLYTPMVADQGQVVGVVKGQLELDSLGDLVAQVRLGKTGIAYVVDDEGRLIAHPNSDLVLSGPNFSSRKIVAQLLGDQSRGTRGFSHIYTNEEGIEVTANGLKLPNLDWVVIMEQPVSEAFEQLLLLRILFYSTLVGSLILLILISLMISENFTRPIRQLQLAADLLQHGKLDARSGIQSGDEIQELSNSFNMMAAKLKATIGELETKVDQLGKQKRMVDHTAKLLLRRDLDLNQSTEELEQEKDTVEAERNKLQVVLAGISDGVLAVDLHRNIIIFNSAAEKITGYKADEVIGKPIDEVFDFFEGSEILMAETFCPIRIDSFEGVVFNKEHLKMVTKKQVSYVNLIVGQIKEGLHVNLGGIITLHDVTKEQELEKMKLDFVSIAAHELRTPLTTVLGYLSFLQQPTTLNKLTSEEQEFVNRASLSAVRLNKLIENLLAASKIEQGRTQVELQPVDLEKIIQKVILETEGLAKTKGLKLNFHPSPEQIPLVMADPSRIEEVLSNLIGNAINYTQHGAVDVYVSRQREMVVTAVQDTGQGIPQEAISHLFTKFFRVQGELQSGSKGTGLGLYISHSIIQSHQGKIWAESTLNKGSTFSFSLPIAE